MIDFLFDGPKSSPLTLALAHGAGAGMDHPFMETMAKAIAQKSGIRVARFEFPYMAAKRADGKKRPPDRSDKLIACYREAIEQLGGADKVVVGGKSMGGRMASLIAEDAGARGLVCLGYPFHPVGKPDQLRTAQLATMRTPTLIVQGTRDPFGTRDEVAGYTLSKAIEILWLEDGDHDLKPRKSISGFTAADHLKTLATTVAAWAGRIGA